MAHILDILSYNAGFYHLSSLDRFTTRDGGEIASEVVIQHDHIVPYCLDDVGQRLIFVDLPPELDLTEVTFVWFEQKQYARRLIAVPYAELADLTAQLPQPKKLILIHNTTRSGSTLLHQIFNEVEGIASFSEPDLFLNLVRSAYEAPDRRDTIDLIRQCFMLFSYPYADQMVSIKFRSQCIELADIFYEIFPTAAQLFLYRNALDWSASWQKLYIQDGATEENVADFKELRRQYSGRSDYMDTMLLDDAPTVLSFMAMLSVWAFCMDAYCTMHEREVPFFALRYEDLNAQRETMLTKLFDYVGLPQAQLMQAMRGFERDSQAGTEYSSRRGKKVTLTATQKQMIHTALAQHPRQFSPDVILPNTTRP